MPPVDGCHCRLCFGFSEWLAEKGIDTRGLPEAPGHTPVKLRVTTLGVPLEVVCDGSMVCACPACVGERVVRLTDRKPAPRQPWDVRKAA